jgi:hypothetical protein
MLKYSNKGSDLLMKDYPKPNVENTENYRVSVPLVNLQRRG